MISSTPGNDQIGHVALEPLAPNRTMFRFDERYNLQKDGPCGGIPSNLCNGDGGLLAAPNTVNALTQLPNVNGSATNPDFLKAGAQFTLPRSLRIGLRLTF